MILHRRHEFNLIGSKINGVIQYRIVKNCGERLHCDSESQGLLYATQCSDSYVGGQKHASIP